MTATVNGCLNHLKSVPAVTGISRCGSHRQGIADAVSDLDIWVFCDDAEPLSEQRAISVYLPADARCEVLFEGRDDTLVDHLVLNVLTERLVLNAKLLRTSVLTAFGTQQPSPDASYLEDLENYCTMQIMHDPHGVIAIHQRWLRLHAVETVTDWLTPQIISRYSAAYWRSVYQGVLREEEHAWRHLVTGMLELLTWLIYLSAGQLPPPRKWLFSPRLLTPVAGGAGISALLDRLYRTRVTDQQAVLDFYRNLADLEDLVLDTDEHLHQGFWWRAIFTTRIPHLATITGNQRLAQLAQTPLPAPRS